jgi:Fe-S cluster assembly protein SufD
VFSGRIVVRQDAQKTNAFQSNKNLLLSKEATIDSKPQLEIFADDVRCTHGATVGRLDDNALFYMRSRGIPREEARRILVRAFAGELLDAVANEELRAFLERILGANLEEKT